MFKVRFNLSKGENFMKWKVHDLNNDIVTYYSPDDFFFIMIGCTLKNNVSTANRIFEGENKSTCAWILCDNIIINKLCSQYNSSCEEIKYNPRIKPHWTNETGDDLDNKKYLKLITFKNKVYATNN